VGGIIKEAILNIHPVAKKLFVASTLFATTILLGTLLIGIGNGRFWPFVVDLYTNTGYLLQCGPAAFTAGLCAAVIMDIVDKKEKKE